MNSSLLKKLLPFVIMLGIGGIEFAGIQFVFNFVIPAGLLAKCITGILIIWFIASALLSSMLTAITIANSQEVTSEIVQMAFMRGLFSFLGPLVLLINPGSMFLAMERYEPN